MKLNVKIELHLKTDEVDAKTKAATKRALKNVLTDSVKDAVRDSPFQFGTNRRSIMFNLGPGKEEAQRELEAAFFTTSGYGGYLEVGTKSMPARPYMKPAWDRHVRNLPKEIKAELK